MHAELLGLRGAQVGNLWFRVILSSCCPRSVPRCKNTKINILPFVLSEHEVSSHTYKVWLFVNGLLSRIFGPEIGEGGWKYQGVQKIG